MDALLKVDHVSKIFGGLRAVNDVSMEVHENSIVSLIGPNGAGKTTLFNVITGFYQADEGDIFFDGIRINDKKVDEYVRFGVARTFQNVRIFKELTVLENVIAGFQGPEKGTVVGPLFNTRKKRKSEMLVKEKAYDLLKEFHYEQYADQKCKNLPYGIQKKLEIIRALACDPKLLLLDEPAAGLNNQESMELRNYIDELKGRGHTILLIEHDMKLVMDISDYVYVLNSGSLLTKGSPGEVQSDPRVIEVYMGKRRDGNVVGK